MGRLYVDLARRITFLAEVWLIPGRMLILNYMLKNIFDVGFFKLQLIKYVFLR
jgi:hypothetical protein